MNFIYTRIGNQKASCRLAEAKVVGKAKGLYEQYLTVKIESGENHLSDGQSRESNGRWPTGRGHA